jgi:hypothetical protein
VNDRDRLRLVEQILAGMDAARYSPEIVDELPDEQLRDTYLAETDRLHVLLQLQAEQIRPTSRPRRRR